MIQHHFLGRNIYVIYKDSKLPKKEVLEFEDDIINVDYGDIPRGYTYRKWELNAIGDSTDEENPKCDSFTFPDSIKDLECGTYQYHFTYRGIEYPFVIIVASEHPTTMCDIVYEDGGEYFIAQRNPEELSDVMYNHNVEHVVIGNKVKHLPDDFLRQSHITWVHIPKNIVSIGDRVFCQSIYLKQANGLKGVKTIGNHFMDGCSDLVEARFETDKLESVGNYYLASTAIQNSQVYMPSVKSIGSHFLHNCSEFNGFIPNFRSIQSIGVEFMAYCKRFDHFLKFGDGLKKIPTGFLRACEKFDQEIDFPDSLEEIGNDFMRGCIRFDNRIRFGEKLHTVGNNFFVSPPPTIKPSVPKTLTKVGKNYMGEYK